MSSSMSRMLGLLNFVNTSIGFIIDNVRINAIEFALDIENTIPF